MTKRYHLSMPPPCGLCCATCGRNERTVSPSPLVRRTAFCRLQWERNQGLVNYRWRCAVRTTQLLYRLKTGVQSASAGAVVINVTNAGWLRSLPVLDCCRGHLSGNRGFLGEVITDRLKDDIPAESTMRVKRPNQSEERSFVKSITVVV